MTCMDGEQNASRFRHPMRHVVVAARFLDGSGSPCPNPSAPMRRGEAEASRDARQGTSM